jgi:hypothetical protein
MAPGAALTQTQLPVFAAVHVTGACLGLPAPITFPSANNEQYGHARAVQETDEQCILVHNSGVPDGMSLRAVAAHLSPAWPSEIITNLPVDKRTAARPIPRTSAEHNNKRDKSKHVHD